MYKIYEIAANLTHPVSLAAFAIAIVLFILKLRRKVPNAVWLVISLLVVVPVLVSAYVEIKRENIQRISKRDDAELIYRVRTTVVDPQRTPVEDANVWSSMGGEAKKVAGGWQFDIPRASKPKDGKLIVYASQPNMFLAGNIEVLLESDFNPNVTIQLRKDSTATVRGMVVDSRNRAVAGAHVTVVGYGTESMITDAGGAFVLPAHAAVGQQVLLHVEKRGYVASDQWHPAGDMPATVTLDRMR